QFVYFGKNEIVDWRSGAVDAYRRLHHLWRRRGFAGVLSARVPRRVGTEDGADRDGIELRDESGVGNSRHPAHLPRRRRAQARGKRGLLRPRHELHAVYAGDVTVVPFTARRASAAATIALKRGSSRRNSKSGSALA